MKKRFQFVLFAVIFSVSAAYAGPPKETRLVYDGTLEQSGAPVTSSGVEFTFTLYDALEGGNTICGPQTQTLPVAAGHFSAKFGEVEGDVNCSNLTDKLQTTDEVYLEIAVAGNTLAPRFKLESVPYAAAAANGVPKGTIIYHQSSHLDGAFWQKLAGPLTIVGVDGTVYSYRRR